jgi:HK97 family phage portal protein
MSLLRLSGRGSTRSIENPSVPISAAQLAALISFGPTRSGVQVTEQTALTFSAVFAAVRVLSEAIGMMPLNVFQRVDKGKQLAETMPAHRLLSTEANPEMTAATFKETFMANLALWGRGAARIECDNAGRPKAIWPLISRITHYERQAGVPQLKVEGGGTFAMEEVLYVPGLSINGVSGLSPIGYAREAIAMGKAAELFGASFFGNGATVDGVLKHPGELSPEAYQRLMESWNRRHQGVDNAHKTAILEEGTTYERIGIPPDDAQFLQTRQFQVLEIARIYRIPPHMLGDLSRSTNNNIEQQSLEFLVQTLSTYTEKIEQEVNRKLLPDSGEYFARFDERRLLRGDLKGRQAFYQSGIQWGYLNRNEVRDMEDMNQIDGGDEYLSPLNMQKVGATPPNDDATDDTANNTKTDPADAPPQRRLPAPPAPPAPSPAKDAALRKLAKAHARIFADAAARMVRKEANAAARAKPGEAWREKFYGEHEHHLREAFTPAAYTLAELAAGGDGLVVELAERVAGGVASYCARYVKTQTGGGAIATETWPTKAATELTEELLTIILK